MTELGRLIREARARRGDSQTVAGVALGVARPLLSRWENGHELPPARRLPALTAYLGADEGTLRELLDPAPPARPGRSLPVSVDPLVLGWRGDPARWAVEAVTGDAGREALAAWVAQRPSWQARGACVDQPTEWFFPGRGGAHLLELARAVCARCVVVDECRAWAFAQPADDLAGVWGGMSQTERQAALDVPESACAAS